MKLPTFISSYFRKSLTRLFGAALLLSSFAFGHESALISAVKESDLEKVKTALESEGGVNAAGKNGATALV
ncbi:MAG: hypothetical protein MUP09_10515 [Thiovulaceae bacterium]|nr:hypothetical protein [Sulfurimonadaceae bacterium]